MSKKQQQTHKKASDLLLRLFISERPKQTKWREGGRGGGGGGETRAKKRPTPSVKSPLGTLVSPERRMLQRDECSRGMNAPER